ncbi:hypothetical protein NIES2119_31850 [[Phormidium ambiguum] IAM M-71]|uniref:Uncharacterized protein n=1 Tax=[Phormidium ambiguum] IAM M-71 TaxID=454136 RepID=A0A1U7I1S1_9CYAN|nr:hypothetical protein [Phormidium ambiguum]OKH29881.1 hypothetical protein NIES2119_31850 [Phormidium ambiguum IAM M-71]
MPTNPSNNTQKSTADRLKSTQDKLIRKIKSILKTATPEEILEVWMLTKQQELKRTTPNLSTQQIETVVKSLILELGYDIITTSSDESEANDLDEDNDTFVDDEDDLSEDLPVPKQQVSALKKVEKLRASTRNGKH